jgi:hypothetical protein
MSRLSHRIDELLAEANDCELIGSLATTPDIRKANLERALQLRRLAERARELERKAPTLFPLASERED